MGINVGMLIFGLIDGSLAYAVVYCLIKSRLKGGKLGRILGTIFGTVTFSVYIALFIRFNTQGVEVNPDLKNIVYAAPIVLSVLLTVLVLLSQPPIQAEAETDETEAEGDETTAAEEAP